MSALKAIIFYIRPLGQLLINYFVAFKKKKKLFCENFDITFMKNIKNRQYN